MSLKKHGFLYLLVPFLLLLVVVFQNCKSDSPLDYSPQPQSPGNISPADPQEPQSLKSLPAEDPQAPSMSTSSISYNIGSLIAYLSAEDESMAKGQFAVGSNIAFNFVHYHPDSDKFKWTISKAFDAVASDQQTAKGQYLFAPQGPGVYDISAISYKDELQATYASKRLIIGDSCKPSSFPEITVTEGFLTVGQTVTFSLHDASRFSSIAWNVTLKSGKLIESSTQSVIVDLTNETDGPILLKVSARDSSGCLTYREKTYYVASELLKPHFNPASLMDNSGTDITLELENNNVYRYKRPSNGTVYNLLLNVKNADACALDGVSLSCSDGRIDFAYLTDNECEEHVTTLSASYQDTRETQEYYNYCPQDSTYCYFGLLNDKPDHYVCPISTRLPSGLLDEDHATAADPSNDVGECCDSPSERNCCKEPGTHLERPSTQVLYRWQCLGRRQHSPFCTSNRPIHGRCGNSYNGHCRNGIRDDLEDDKIHYKWRCLGEYGGNDSTCYKRKRGVCDNGNKYQCISGRVINRGQDNNEYEWKCAGDPNSGKCESPRDFPGDCSGRRYRCDRGTASEQSGDKTHYTWKCSGVQGGHSVPCKRLRPGECDYSQGLPSDACKYGTFRNTRDSDEHYKWECRGSSTQKCKQRKVCTGTGSYSSRSVCQSGLSSNRECYQIGQCWHRRIRPCSGSGQYSNRSVCQSGLPSGQECYQSGQCWQRRTPSPTCNPPHTVLRGSRCVPSCGKAGGNASGSECNDRTNYNIRMITDTYQRPCCVRTRKSAVHGQCHSSHYNCEIGTAILRRAGGTRWTWHCQGSNGGRTVSCSENKPSVCTGTGSYSSLSVCQSGLSSNRECYQIGQCWHRRIRPCSGSGQYSNRSVCQSGLPSGQECYQSGQCWQRRTPSPTCNPPHTVLRGSRCVPSCGKAGGNASGSECNDRTNYNIRMITDTYQRPCCVRTRKSAVHGQCHSSHYNCEIGTAILRRAGGTQWTWHCQGSNGGRTVSCSENKPSVCTGTGSYSSLSVCQSGLSSNRECYQIGQCWHRRIRPCSGSGQYSNRSVCQSGLPSGQECYQSGQCWQRRTPSPTCNPPHTVLRGSRCVPSCGKAGGNASGSECNDRTNYNIRMITDTYQRPCCVRTPKARPVHRRGGGGGSSGNEGGCFGRSDACEGNSMSEAGDGG